MKGLVIKKLSDKFRVSVQGETVLAFARGNLKEKGICVGDVVDYNAETKQIEAVFERKNKLVRPPICNLDNLFILIADTPKPDFLVLDKLLLFCKVNDITPIICHSKTDENNDILPYIQRTYGKYFKVIDTSAHKKIGINEIKYLLLNKTSAFAGQSGVGKSGLLNAIFGKDMTKEGVLSEKIERGKNTTRHTELYELSTNTYIADTAGFSSLDESYLPLKKAELPYYYPEFLEFLPKCKYKSCAHINEEICGVKDALRLGQIDEGRYQRYIEIRSKLT